MSPHELLAFSEGVARVRRSEADRWRHDRTVGSHKTMKKDDAARANRKSPLRESRISVKWRPQTVRVEVDIAISLNSALLQALAWIVV
jgi:hypothetical protein